jgi:hypothetical protein
MNLNKYAQSAASGLFSGGATVSAGFLSFAGMFIISPGLSLCLTALVLAIAYEGQVYHEGISKALRRLFDYNYLKKGLADREINVALGKLKKQYRHLQIENISNRFLATYFELQSFIHAVEHDHHLSVELAAEKEKAEDQLEDLKLSFVKQLNNRNTRAKLTTQEDFIEAIIGRKRDALRKEIFRKSWLISLSWIFAIAGGISSGFAGLYAISEGVATLALTFPLVAAIPFSVVAGLAVFAAFGYTFMLYQTMSDAVQQYNGEWRKYCKPKVGESPWTYRLRMAGITTVVALGIFATVATAGTWWFATNRGALLVNWSQAAAARIRNLSVPLMTFATLVYNVSNSLITIDNISKSHYGKLIVNYLESIEILWAEESFLQFINPFRFLAVLIDNTINGVLFVGHIISMGLISDRLEGLPPALTASLIAVNEAMVDMQYLNENEEEHEHLHAHSHHAHHPGSGGRGGPDGPGDHDHDDHDHGDDSGHNHSHDSIIKSILLAPFKLIVYGCQLAAVAWDAPFEREEDVSAWDKFFPTEQEKAVPVKPELINQWHSSSFVIHSSIGAMPVELDSQEQTKTTTFSPQNGHHHRFQNGHNQSHGASSHTDPANDQLLVGERKKFQQTV